MQEPQVLSVSSFLQNGYVLALICFVAMMLKQMLFQNSFFLASRQAIRCKGAVQVGNAPMSCLNNCISLKV